MADHVRHYNVSRFGVERYETPQVRKLQLPFIKS